MSNALTLIDGRPLPTRPINVASLQPPERDLHRAEIGVVIDAMLTSWFQPTLSEAAATAAMVDWMDELQGFSPKLIRQAFVNYRSEDAVGARREGRAPRRPNPAQIRLICAELWGKRVIEKAKVEGLLAAPEPRPEPVSKERAAQIMAEVGFHPKRIERAAE